MHSGWIFVNSTSREFGIQMLHGSTLFEGSNFERDRTAPDCYMAAGYNTVWTAVASEGVKMQFNVSNAASTTNYDNGVLMAVEISEDLTEDVDWHFSEDTTDHTCDTVYGDSDDASITIDSADHAVNDDFLVIGINRYDVNSSSALFFSRIERTGEATDTEIETITEGEDSNNDFLAYMLFQVWSLGAASNTFKEQARIDSGTFTRTYNNIFAINLDKFDVHNFAYTSASFGNMSSTNYASQLQTSTIQPTVTGDVALLGIFIGNPSGTTTGYKGRIRADDNSDVLQDFPPTVTSDSYVQNGALDGNADRTSWHTVAIATSWDTDVHDIEMDGSSTTSVSAERRLIVAFTFELAAAPTGVEFTPLVQNNSLVI